MSPESHCPGSRLFREPEPDDFPCPSCGTLVEIWTDEQRRRCPNCGTTVSRATEEVPSCIGWCASARLCLGPERYDRWLSEHNGSGH